MNPELSPKERRSLYARRAFWGFERHVETHEHSLRARASAKASKIDRILESGGVPLGNAVAILYKRERRRRAEHGTEYQWEVAVADRDTVVAFASQRLPHLVDALRLAPLPPHVTVLVLDDARAIVVNHCSQLEADFA